MDKKELGAINGLKYLLMMCIVSGHYYNSFALTEEALPHYRGYRLLFYNAHLGVEVFFFHQWLSDGQCHACQKGKLWLFYRQEA